jgi:aminoglycoside phosphotransferase (APT) family kinase protein
VSWERIGADFGFRGIVGRATLDDDRSVVMKIASHEGAANEARFYEQIDDAPAPRAYHVASDGDLVVLVLEDLSSGRHGDALLGCSLDDAALVLERMAAFDVPGDGFQRWSDRLARRQERYDSAVDVFLQRYGDRFPAEIRAFAQALRGQLARVVAPLGEGGRLIHGDLHLDNVIFDDDRPVIIDWQTACVGHPTLDFVTFVYSSLTIDDRRTIEAELSPELLPQALINAFAGHVLWFARPDVDELEGRERAFLDQALSDGRLVSGLLDHGTLALAAV